MEFGYKKTFSKEKFFFGSMASMVGRKSPPCLKEGGPL